MKDIVPGTASSYPVELMVLNGMLCFGATDGSHGLELWRSDGTADGTYMVKDMNPGSGIGFCGSGICFK